ncbi:nitroreductase family protein [Herpetosiphon llansteffanensis]
MSEHFFGAGVSASSYVHEWTSLQRGNALPEPNQPAGDWWHDLFEAKSKINLPAAYPIQLSYQQLIQQRQSLREYAERPINLADLATFLEYASRPLNPATKPVSLLAPLVLNSADLALGGYAYNPNAHQLAVLRTADPQEPLQRYCFQREFLQAPVIVLVLSSLPNAINQAGDRGYRQALLDAGAQLQRLYVAAQRVGMIGCATGSLIQGQLARWLGFDSYQTHVLIGFAVGYPHKEQTHD